MTQARRRPVARPVQNGSDFARARSIDCGRGLHPEFSPAAASAPDPAVARQPADRSPLRRRHRRKRRRGTREPCRRRRHPGARQLAGLCVVEPRQGNCQAINAAFETALATFPAAKHFLMIDDDEIASPDWLERMLHAAEATGADVVGGPVWPHFDDGQNRDLRHHPAFRPAYDSSGPVSVIYGCGNCLITRSVFARLGQPAFDLRFNFLGGGDTDFFIRCRRGRPDVPLGRRGGHHRNRAAQPDQSGLAGAARPAHRRDQLSRPAQAGRTAWSQARLILKMLALLPLSLFRAVADCLGRARPH